MSRTWLGLRDVALPGWRGSGGGIGKPSDSKRTMGILHHEWPTITVNLHAIMPLLKLPVTQLSVTTLWHVLCSAGIVEQAIVWIAVRKYVHVGVVVAGGLGAPAPLPWVLLKVIVPCAWREVLPTPGAAHTPTPCCILRRWHSGQPGTISPIITI